MYRMSQGLLIILFLIINISFAYGIERVISLSYAPDGTPLINPHSVIFKKNKFYVADSGNGRLISYDLRGNPLVALNPKEKLKRPIDLAFRKEDELWVIDKELGGLYKVNFSKKEVREYILNYKNIRLRPEIFQIYEDKMYILDREIGAIAVVSFKEDNLIVEKILKPEDENFKGFVDFRINKKGLWGLSRLNKKVYHLKPDGEWEIYLLKGKVILPKSLEVKDNYLFILDRYLAKVIIFKLPSLTKIEEFGEKGWTVGKFYRPIRIRNLYLNYIGIVDEGNGRVEIFQY